MIFLRVFSPHAEKKEKIKRAFECFDVDDDGKVGRDDLKRILNMMTGQYLEKEKIQQIIELILDESGAKKGYLDLKSFEKSFDEGQIEQLMTLNWTTVIHELD